MPEIELEEMAATDRRIAVPATSIDEDDSVDLVAVFRKLHGERATILRFTMAVFAIATLVAFLLPLRYTSTTSFIPPASVGNGSSMASLVAGQLSSSLGASELLGSKSPADLYAGILKSRYIADKLIKRFDLMRIYKVKKLSRAEKMLAADTEVGVDTKSSIVTVDVTAKSPQLAHDLGSAYMDALQETNGRLAIGQSSQRRLFFEQQLAQEKDKLAHAEVELKKTEEQSGLIAPIGQTQTEISTIAQTQAQIALRQVQLAALRDSATEQNPDVIRLRSEIGDLEGQLARLQKGSDTNSTLAIPTSKVPELQLEFVRKEREVKYHEALFEMLSRQYEAARLDEAREAPVVQVLDPASYPDTKSAPKRLYYMASGLAGGLLAGCVWVLIREHVKSRRAFIAPGGTA